MLRPRPARWFEILAARDDATLVLEALARTGAVELEARGDTGLPATLRDALPLLAQYTDLAARYAAYWPAPETCRPSAFPEPPVTTLQRCLDALRAWAQDAEPAIRTLQRCDTEKRELQLWQGVLAALAPGTLDPAHLAGAGPHLNVRLFVLPAGVDAQKIDALLALVGGAGGAGPAHASRGAAADVPPGDLATRPDEPETLVSALHIDGAAHLLVAGPPQALQTFGQAVSALEGRAHEPPLWLHADAAQNQAHVNERLAAIERDMLEQRALLAALHRRHDLPCALGDANRLDWLMRNVRALEAGELLCWITGWSSDLSGAALAHAVQSSGARALLHFAEPPAHSQAPMLLSNPGWVRPFEIFSRALGMPSGSEADPSALLAVVVPLMFGYMFGDVGQGLVLAGVAAVLRKRYPIARLLLVGGLAATGFGFLFGSVFGVHGVLPALWLHPLDAPLPVLLAPLAGGAVLLTLGLCLNALEAVWRGAWLSWLLTDAALIVIYLALLLAYFVPAAGVVAAAGAVYFCVGHAVLAHRGAAAVHTARSAVALSAALGAVGELLEKTLQILINTLSFARVGAFALAHAGLSSAIVALMDAADSLLAKALILIVGNVVVIVLEVMVVAIQTTRLVLFEFFTRFMQAKGRTFQPLSAPPFTHPEAR
jgi:V/A-type H+/Na+-transporting ATPase subunit I